MINPQKIFFLILACLTLFQPIQSRAEKNLVSLISEVKPGIVAIGTYYFNDIPKVRFYGTGFVVGRGGRVVTNHHVVEQIEEKNAVDRLRVFHETLPDTGIEAGVVEKDATHDLAILGIKAGKLSSLRLGDSKKVREGQAVAFTGYPIGLVLGLNPTTHVGIISAIAPILIPSPTARAIKSELIAYLRNPYDIFQVDATAYPGNSGSPVYLRDTGEVIGVINMVFVKGKKEHVLKEPTGITYAIPIDHVKKLLEGTSLKK